MSASNDFINRANGTVIEGKLDILFNLLLVKKNARLAYLLEVSNFPMIDSEELIKIIKTKYPEFIYTIEHEIGGNPHRIFIHINSLIPKGDMEHDIWVAKNLGFSCLGIPDENNIRYSVHYTINNKVFYAEICPTKELIINKIPLFKPVAKELDWTLNETIEKIFPRDIWLKKLIIDVDYDWLLANANNFVEFLLGFGFSYIQEIIKDFKTNHDGIEYLLKDKFNLLLFTTIRSQRDRDPFSIFWPLSVEMSQYFEEIEKEQFIKENEPIIAFENVECIFRNKYPQIWSDEMRTIFRIKKNELFYYYDSYKIQSGGKILKEHYKINYQKIL